MSVRHQEKSRHERRRCDVAKAEASGACELWIVVPNPTVAQSVANKLLQQPHTPENLKLFIFYLPQALQRLEELFDLFSETIPNRKKKNKEMKRANKQGVHRYQHDDREIGVAVDDPEPPEDGRTPPDTNLIS